MSGWVTYPYHVRHNGVDYNPGVPIKVDDPIACVRRGATIMETAVETHEAAAVNEPANVQRKHGRRKVAQ